MAAKTLHDRVCWGRAQEASLCHQFGFREVQEAMVDCKTYNSAMKAANHIHERFVQGKYGHTPIVKFFNYQMPSKHTPFTEVLAHAKCLGFESVATKTKIFDVMKQDWIKCKIEGFYLKNTEDRFDKFSYTLFPEFQMPDLCKEVDEYWAGIENGMSTYYSADFSWAEVFQEPSPTR